MVIGERRGGMAAALPYSVRRRGISAVWAARAAWSALGLALAVVLVTSWAYVHGALTYLDNGDGLYLYPAQRLAQGAVLYRDVMATQPPVVYVLNAAVLKAGLSLAGVRLLSAIMRAVCVALVYLLGLRLFRDRLTASLAGLLYALLPIGLAWDRSTNSNSPLTLLLLLSACVFARFTPRSARLAGLLAALALFTKDLYLPILAATLLYLLHQQRRLLPPYLQGLVCGVAALAVALLAYAGPVGLRDAFLGQDASPLNPAWFVASLAYVVSNEGGILLAALAGAWVCLRETRRSRTDSAGRIYAPYLLLGAAAMMLATLKEGTFGTVFQCAEPVVALLAAYALVWAARSPRAGIRDALFGGILAALVALVALSGASVIASDRAALAANNAAVVAHVAALVRRVASPGSVILAPPYYAVLTTTRLPGDVSDTYIMAQRARRDDPVATAWLSGIIRAVSDGRYPIVVVDQHIAALPAVMAALRPRYHPVYGDTLPPSVHAVVWLPNK